MSRSPHYETESERSRVLTDQPQEPHDYWDRLLSLMEITGKAAEPPIDVSEQSARVDDRLETPHRRRRAFRDR